MRISEINIYPVKSLKGISLNEAVVEDRGLQLDRRWMLVDDANQFMTQREFPAMARIEVTADKSGLTVSIDGRMLEIPVVPDTGNLEIVTVWNSKVGVIVYDNDVNQWFSEILQSDCRLVLMTEASKRKVNPDYAVRKYHDTVSFADGYPFMLIGENSLADLNSRLAVPLPMNRFRPNMVVSGSDIFAEDTWKKIRIGTTIFHIVKPSERCVITTIDQARGEKDGKEPLKTLATYRNQNGGVMFGQNLIAENPGEVIKIGDRVEVVEMQV